MELPRSRRTAHSPLGPKTECALPPSTCITVTDENKFKAGPVLFACVVVFAVLAVSSLYYNLFSVICENQLDQPETHHFEVHPITPTSRTDNDRQFQILSAASKGGLERIEADRTLGGLLPDVVEFEADRCASRDDQPHRKTNLKPSKELIQRLRNYEVRHRACAGRAQSFFRSNYGSQYEGSGFEGQGDDCRYVVWIAYSGLGNRLMTLVSAFLYALLTDRTLLVDKSKDMGELFCEPIPKTSWLLPSEFTVEWLTRLNESSPGRFRHSFTDESHNLTADFSYIHLTHTCDHKDEEFFCDSGQDDLATVPWVFIRSNNYLVPAYFFVSKFSSDLEALFPDKEAIFHLLGRYLFHPSDAVWAWLTRFYRSYLADKGQLVAIQIRTFSDDSLPYVSEQIQQCVRDHDLLPRVVADPDSAVNMKRHDSGLRAPRNSTAVLMTALQSYYYENLRDYYLSGPTEGGEIVAIHQPSHEGWQQTDKADHDLKAWAEIYLLSLSDSLITSGWSTFGYSAQALAGIRPWILQRSIDGKVPDPPCVRARSIEPCYHAFPQLQCPLADGADPAEKIPYVQSCEDVSWGRKVITEPSSLAWKQL